MLKPTKIIIFSILCASSLIVTELQAQVAFRVGDQIFQATAPAAKTTAGFAGVAEGRIRTATVNLTGHGDWLCPVAATGAQTTSAGAHPQISDIKWGEEGYTKAFLTIGGADHMGRIAGDGVIFDDVVCPIVGNVGIYFTK